MPRHYLRAAGGTFRRRTSYVRPLIAGATALGGAALGAYNAYRVYRGTRAGFRQTGGRTRLRATRRRARTTGGNFGYRRGRKAGRVNTHMTRSRIQGRGVSAKSTVKVVQETLLQSTVSNTTPYDWKSETDAGNVHWVAWFSVVSNPFSFLPSQVIATPGCDTSVMPRSDGTDWKGYHGHVHTLLENNHVKTHCEQFASARVKSMRVEIQIIYGIDQNPTWAASNKSFSMFRCHTCWDPYHVGGLNTLRASGNQTVAANKVKISFDEMKQMRYYKTFDFMPGGSSTVSAMPQKPARKYVVFNVAFPRPDQTDRTIQGDPSTDAVLPQNWDRRALKDVAFGSAYEILAVPAFRTGCVHVCIERIDTPFDTAATDVLTQSILFWPVRVYTVHEIELADPIAGIGAQADDE